MRHTSQLKLFLLLFFLNLLFLNVFIAKKIENKQSTPIDVTFETLPVNVLGTQMELALINAKFDKELYLLDGYHCFNSTPEISNIQLFNISNECLDCNFALKETCIKNTKQFNNCPKNCTDIFCQEGEWGTLKKDLTNHIVQEKKYIHYRFYVEDTVDSAIVLRIFPIKGKIAGYFSKDIPFPNKYNYNFEVERYINVCPGEPRMQKGTYFLSIYGYFDSEFLLYFNLPKIQQSTTELAVNKTIKGLKSLENNKLILINLNVSFGEGFFISEFKLFSYTINLPVDTCKFVEFVFASNESVPVIAIVDYSDNYEKDIINKNVRYIGASNQNIQSIFSICGSDEYNINPNYDGQKTFIFAVSHQVPGSAFLAVNSRPIEDKNIFIIEFSKFDGSFPAYFSFLSSASLECGSEQNLTTFNCHLYEDRFCDNFWSVFPQENIEPFIPLPFILRPLVFVDYSDFYSLRNKEDIKFLEKTYSAVLILNYQPNGNSISFLPKEDLTSCKIKFNGRFTNSGGLPIQSIVSNIRDITIPTQKFEAPLCDTEAFHIQSESFDLAVRSAGTITESTGTNYMLEIDTITVSPGWYRCRKRVEEFFNFETVEVIVNSTDCTFVPETKEYLEDSCCNEKLQWKQCCSSKSNKINITNLVLQQNPEIWNDPEFACSSEDCAESILSDYRQWYISSQIPATRCPLASKKDQEAAQIYLVYAKCQVKSFGIDFKGIKCYDDSDCIFQTSNKKYTCDLTQQRCIIPFSEAEREMVNCFVSNSDVFVKFFLIKRFNFSNDITNEMIIDFLTGWLKDEDCTGLYHTGLEYRFHQRFENVEENCKDDCSITFEGDTECLDNKCQIHPACFSSNICPREWVYIESQGKQKCETSESLCNWFDCSNLNQKQCENKCKTKENKDYFCGVCSSENRCFEIESEKNHQSCSNLGFVCLLPNGTIIENINEDQCFQLGQCSTKCQGSGCSSVNDLSGVCIAQVQNEKDCQKENGKWIESDKICHMEFINSLSSCQQSKYKWESCDYLDQPTCAACESLIFSTQDSKGDCPIKSISLLKCFRDIWRPCNSRSECEVAGKCHETSSLNFLSNGQRYIEQSMWTNKYTSINENQTTPIQGKCLEEYDKFYPREEIANFPQLIALTRTFPFCQIKQNDGMSYAPSGCFDLKIKSKKECKKEQGIWVEPPKNEQECIKSAFINNGFGCENELTSSIDYISPSDCAICNKKAASFHSWVKGRWINAKFIRTEWLETKFLETTLKWTQTINFTKFTNLIDECTLARLINPRLSNGYCRYYTLRHVSNEIVCDCCNNETSTNCDAFDSRSRCYDRDNIISEAGAEACSDSIIELQVPGAKFNLPTGNIREQDLCAKIIIKQRPADFFARITEIRTTFTSSWIRFPYKKYTKYEIVQNKKDAVIGQILSDGIEITGYSIKNATLCLNFFGNISIVDSSYTEYDYGIKFDYEDWVYPLEVKDFILKPLGIFDQACATIEDIEIESNKSIFIFIIIRKENNWETENSATEFTSGEIIYIYICASVFSINIIFALFLVLSVIILKLSTQIALTMFLFLILIFNLLRSITLFLIASKEIDRYDEEAFYILMDIPTLIYLTAFSIIVYLWFLTFRLLKEKFLLIILVFFNILIYATFVLLIILFNVLPKQEIEVTEAEEICRRGTIVDDDSMSNQQIIATTYQSFLAAIALLISLCSAIVAHKVRNLWQTSLQKAVLVKLLFTISVSAISFIAQAIFMIVVIITEYWNLYVFLTLMVILEALPCLIMLISVSPNPQVIKKAYYSKFTQSGIGSSTLNSGAHHTNSMNSKISRKLTNDQNKVINSNSNSNSNN
eukprot:TRINITY_DN1010_c0_g1_i11.p1 TRINITY_DN1010_c0_g1~~TRINITY_DN1010_c0_g1_i11.p1  ORF type:complete len:1846 (+),score=582.36 TRINITY_DN1010_c0_g1_i11:47-5539(+)